MKWLEIISVRCSSNVDTRVVDELLKDISESDSSIGAPKHLIEVRAYHHSVVETDISIHIYWQSEVGTQGKSPLGLRFSSALRSLGLLNHSVWVETGALESLPAFRKAGHRDIMSLADPRPGNGRRRP